MDRARKKLKGDNASETTATTATTATAALARPLAVALDKLSQLEQLLACFPRSRVADLYSAIASAGEALGVLEATAIPGQVGVEGHRAHDLETVGKKLWNRSRLANKAPGSSDNGEEGPHPTQRLLKAKLRHLALRTIRFSMSSTTTIEQTLLLFELTTRTASSFLESDEQTLLRTLETDAADLGDAFKDLSQLDSGLRSRCALATLDFSIYRIRLSMLAGSSAVTQWMREKTKALIKREPAITSRKIRDIVGIVYRTGRMLALKTQECEQTEASYGPAIEWLEWAWELLQLRPDRAHRALNVAILRCLHFAQSQVDSTRQDGEATLKELIVRVHIRRLMSSPTEGDARQKLESTFAHKRQLLVMVLERAGTDSEVIDGFLSLVSDAVKSEEQASIVIADISHVTDKRRSLRLQVIRSLSERVVSTWSSLHRDGEGEISGHFLEQLLSIAAINIRFEDLEYMSSVFEELEKDAPDFRLSQAAAFLIATYIQSITQTTEDEARLVESARWTALILSAPFAALDVSFRAQSARTVACSFVESKRYEQADAILFEWSKQEQDARTELLHYQIALRLGATEQARSRFISACSAPNLTTDALVWAARQANDCSDEGTLRMILSVILSAAREQRTMEGIDPMTASRLILRMTLEKLQSTDARIDADAVATVADALSRTLEIAHILFDQGSERYQDFDKSLTWIRLAAIEFGATVAKGFDPAFLAQFYETISSFADLELSVAGPSEELLSSLFACRLATLAAHASITRKLAPEDQPEQYRSLLNRLKPFQTKLVDARTEHSRYFPENDCKTLGNAALSLEAECHAALAQWKDLLGLIEVLESDDSANESSLAVVRIVADKVSSGIACPYELLRSIYRKTLAILYRNRALDSSEMAIWLRMMSQVLLVREPNEAFGYLQNAQQLVASDPSGYPDEEISWLVSTAWDQGLEMYSSGVTARDEYGKWCQLAITIAESANDQSLAHQLEEWYTGLPKEIGEMVTTQK